MKIYEVSAEWDIICNEGTPIQFNFIESRSEFFEDRDDAENLLAHLKTLDNVGSPCIVEIDVVKSTKEDLNHHGEKGKET